MSWFAVQTEAERIKTRSQFWGRKRRAWFASGKVAKSSAKILRLASAALVVSSFVIIRVFNINQIGSSMQWKDGEARVSAGAHPAVLLWEFVAIGLFIGLMLRNSNVSAAGVPRRWRRILAFFIDSWFSLLAVSGITAMLPLWLEAARTGHFAWHFERTYAVNGDTYGVLGVFIFMAILVLYYTFPLTRGRPTVGCFIMRLRVAPPFGDRGRFTLRDALKRSFYEFTGLSTFLTRRWDRDGEGRTWYDIKTNCTVVLVEDD